MGRPTYKFSHMELCFIKAMIKNGKTHKEIAEICGISESTFRSRLKQNKFHAEALELKKYAVGAVEESLFEQCFSREKHQIKYVYEKNPKTNKMKPVISEMKKETILPDITAAKLYLMNNKDGGFVTNVTTVIDKSNNENQPTEIVFTIKRKEDFEKDKQENKQENIEVKDEQK